MTTHIPKVDERERQWFVLDAKDQVLGKLAARAAAILTVGVATGAVWAVVWQSTLLAAGVTLAALLLRRSSPAVHYWLWQIVALKLLLMPFWTLAVPFPSFAPRAEPPAPALSAPAESLPLADVRQSNVVDSEMLEPAAAPPPRRASTSG